MRKYWLLIAAAAARLCQERPRLVEEPKGLPIQIFVTESLASLTLEDLKIILMSLATAVSASVTDSKLARTKRDRILGPPREDENRPRPSPTFALLQELALKLFNRHRHSND